MCGFGRSRQPAVQSPAVRTLATPASPAAVKEGEYERVLRRSRMGAAADILTTPLGLPGVGAGG